MISTSHRLLVIIKSAAARPSQKRARWKQLILTVKKDMPPYLETMGENRRSTISLFFVSIHNKIN